MHPHKKDFISIKRHSRKVLLGFNRLTIEDSGNIIIYIPSVNLSAYGNTIKEAEEMMGVVLDDFCESLLNLNEVNMRKQLSEFGFRLNKYFNKRFENSAYIDKEGVLRNFNLPAETKINSEYLSLAI